MTFLKNKFFKSSNKTNVSGQEISSTYVEIQGSRATIEKLNTSSDLYYYFSFSISVRATSPYDKGFLHVKLQKSNDDFSSNIVDVTGCNYNFSTDTSSVASDHLYKINNPMFIVQNTDNDYLRLVVRAYSSNNRALLHLTPHYDGTVGNTLYYYPTLIIKEL
tara:strand:- start:959 stop:1444 length:486 start_codon:yes stop_codon:yes gene_type:complete